MQINITNKVSLGRISDLLCDALEGGSNHWYEIVKFVEPAKLEFLSSPELNGGKPFRHIDYPLNVGGALHIKSLEEPKKPVAIVNLRTIRKGLELMAREQPTAWADFIAENDDAETGDIFLQLVCYGEVIYG